MTTHPMKRVTIVTEALALEAIKVLLADIGAHGYTSFPVAGAGAQGERPADIAEFGNAQVEVILQPAMADALLTRLQRDFFPRYAMIAYESDVRVLRQGKF